MAFWLLMTKGRASPPNTDKQTTREGAGKAEISQARLKGNVFLWTRHLTIHGGGLSFCPEATCPTGSYVNTCPEAFPRTGLASGSPDPNEDRQSAASHET